MRRTHAAAATLIVLAAAVLHGRPALAIPDCDQPVPPPICDPGGDPPPPADRVPFGAFESLRVEWGQTMRVRGWAIDRDTASGIMVNVHVDGLLRQTIIANVYRPDVAAAYPGTGSSRGFDATLTVSPGQNVCLTAVNKPTGVSPAAASKPLGCKSFGNTVRRIGSDDPALGTGPMRASTTEADTFSFGDTVVAAYQVGRFESGGGAANIGVSVSTDAGLTWSQKYLPSITVAAGGPHPRVSDPAVAYDRAHNIWLVVSLPIYPGLDGKGVLISRSTDGAATWSAPIWAMGNDGGAWDKTWVVCDNGLHSRHYGRCYVQANDNFRVYLATSTDGGLTWSGRTRPANNPAGVGGPIVVQPNGTAVAFFLSGNALNAVASTTGGATWNAPVTVATVATHDVTLMRDWYPIPSAEVDGTGKVLLVWQDCRFTSGCARNDIVMSTSTDAVNWTTPAVVARRTLASDLFLPGIGVDEFGGVGLVYHAETDPDCTLTGGQLFFKPACAVSVFFQSSTDSGATWSQPQLLAGPMQVQHMARTGADGMIGDYVSTSIVRANAVTVFAVAAGPGTSTPSLDQAMYVAGPLPLTGYYQTYAWTSQGSGPITSGLIAKCIDVSNASPADGTKVQLWTCNGTSAQEWNYTAQTVRAMGKCLDVRNGATTTGSPLRIWTCSGDGAQRWIKQANGSLYNPQSNKCIDVPSTGDGTQLQIWDCNSAPWQRWYPVTYAASDVLLPGQQLNQNTFLRSADGRFKLILQADNNLVLYGQAFQPLWATNTGGAAVRLTMQTDGNVVLYNGANNPIWSTNTYGTAGHHLVVQNDGNLVLYSAGGQPIWHTGTGGH